MLEPPYHLIVWFIDIGYETYTGSPGIFRVPLPIVTKDRFVGSNGERLRAVRDDLHQIQLKATLYKTTAEAPACDEVVRNAQELAHHQLEQCKCGGLLHDMLVVHFHSDLLIGKPDIFACEWNVGFFVFEVIRKFLEARVRSDISVCH